MSSEEDATLFDHALFDEVEFDFDGVTTLPTIIPPAPVPMGAISVALQMAGTLSVVEPPTCTF